MKRIRRKLESFRGSLLEADSFNFSGLFNALALDIFEDDCEHPSQVR
jgi:hypothetical protein